MNTIADAFIEQEEAAIRKAIEDSAAAIKQRLDEQLHGLGDDAERNRLLKKAADEYIAKAMVALHASFGCTFEDCKLPGHQKTGVIA